MILFINYYSHLGIIDYNDFIYKLSDNTKALSSIINQNQVVKDKVSSIVLADVINSNVNIEAGEKS